MAKAGLLRALTGLLFTPALLAPPPAANAADAPVRIDGRELLAPATASITRSEDALVLRGWEGSTVVLSRPTYLAAAPYRYAQVTVGGLDAAQRLFFGWTTRDADGTRRAGANLPWTGRDRVTIALPDDWSGNVIELALGLTGQPREDVRVQAVTLLPAGVGPASAALVDRALSFRTWAPSDSNRLDGAEAGSWLSPAAAATLAGGILLGPLLLAVRLRGASGRTGALAVAIVAGCLWLALDGLWQRRLLLQLAETQAAFAGLKGEERSRADLDAPQYRLAQQLAPRLPTSPDRRLFILHRAHDHNLERLRTQYHLLPRNSYNVDRQLPQPGSFRPGDHVLVLGAVPGVHFDEDRGLLRDEQRALPARAVTAQGPARLFRLTAPGEDTAQ